jgi:hypothetical protein
MLHAWVEFNNAIPANQLTAVMVAVFHFGIMREGSQNIAVGQSSSEHNTQSAPSGAAHA